MSTDIESIRSQLLEATRDEDKRQRDWPHDWKPTEVNNPESGEPFTNESAWDLVIACLESGIQLVAVEQTKPRKSMAYVMIHELSDGWKVYIKLRLERGKILGRSFHYDETQLDQ